MNNCEIELDLSWTNNCAISEISRTPEAPANSTASPPTDRFPSTQTSGATFQINSTDLYVPVVSLSINDKIKFLENKEQEFKRTISWNKYRSEVATQPKNINLEYIIDPKFSNVNRLFVL